MCHFRGVVTLAGVGPAPKDPSKRARRNADVVQLRVVTAEPAPQPELPEFTVQVTVDGEFESQKFVWPEATREWWAALALHPLVHEFIETDWSYLLDTARLHAAFWGENNLKLAPEIRLREAKYGFTPEDRLRLRIQFAQANGAEDEVEKKRIESASRDRARGVKRAD